MNILEMLYRVDLNKNELFVCKIGKVKVKTEDKLDRESDVYKFMLKQNLSFQELVLCTLVCPFIREFHTELIKSNKIKILYKVKSRYYEPIHLVKKNKKYKDFSIFSQERIYSNGQEVIYEISNNTIQDEIGYLMTEKEKRKNRISIARLKQIEKQLNEEEKQLN